MNRLVGLWFLAARAARRRDGQRFREGTRLYSILARASAGVLTFMVL